MAPSGDSPLGWPVSVAKLPDSGRTERFVASEAQRTALAEAHDLLAVSAFEATFDVRRFRRDGAKVKGRLKAEITQACVVTLEPVLASMDVEFEGRFIPQMETQRVETEIIFDPDGDDAPEPFDPPMIDLGAFAEEHFVLALDPYPRLEGALLDNGNDAADEPEENPFAALQSLKPDH